VAASRGKGRPKFGAPPKSRADFILSFKVTGIEWLISSRTKSPSSTGGGVLLLETESTLLRTLV
jgi:hypothetical protein